MTFQENKNTSRQDYETPPDFIAAVVERFGPLDVDLACGPKLQTTMPLDGVYPDTRKAPVGLCYPQIDSLTVPWGDLYGDSTCWLNMPFGSAGDWYAKCASEYERFSTGKILALSPASIDTNYFADYVWGRALVLALRPRIVFVGEVDPFKKPLMLCVYGAAPGFDVWRWKPEREASAPRVRRREIEVIE